ncbi:nuclear transport factor 2 family protein [Crenobacter sp. SG2305]|uniref:YybH family protein n=1 Tax=Crenobacter oryzisoli TaxID=3056844 RepID=UPI0025AB450C|nr:nuclear transport factor 2 family protein [Crenobacter sp. SG2305]MDN0084133.1 nuclear transport factor 2 family protein [Crenobacter sp. SG2305]
MDDERAIYTLLEAWHRATVAGDNAALLELVCDDVCFYTAGSPPLSGKEAFAAALQANTAFDIDYDWQVDDLAISDTLAYYCGRLRVHMRDRATGATHTRHGHTLTVLRREADGAWRISRDANLLAADNEEAY